MHEILFQYGSITLTTFNALLVVGFLLGSVFMVRYAQFKKLSLRFLVNHLFWFVPAALFGGRLAYLAEHFDFYSHSPLSMLYVWDGGYSAFGVFYMTVGLLAYFCHRDHEDFWSWLDAFVLAGLVGLFFIHLGHFFGGTEYGKPTDVPWGIAFDTFNIPFLTPIHPVQLYSALATFAVFNAGMLRAKRTHLAGVAGTLALMLYSLSAFGIDFFHGEPSMVVKISHGVIASLGFIFHIHCTHRKLLSAHHSDPEKQ